MENANIVSAEGVAALVEAFKGLTEENKKRAKKVNFDAIEADVQYNGKKITLPDDPGKMTYDQGIKWLMQLKEKDEQVVGIHEVIDAHPWDGAFAFMRAMKEMFGWARPIPTPGFFGPRPPKMISIDIAHNEKAHIFWGQFQLPGLEATLACDVDQSDGRPKFLIGGHAKRKHMEAIALLAQLTRRIVAESSIYKGKALRLDTDSDGDLDWQKPPKFMNVSRVNESELVFSADLMEQVTTNLWTPILYTDECRKNRVPLKRGVLLEGPYGTGKTLCATVTAKLCEQNGWTFVTVPRVSALEAALHFAAAYPPCVVFLEDIDRSMSGERTVKMDDVLNTVDGIISKNSEVMTVLTSNHAEDINRAMLRPGRLDAVLHIGAPDAEAVEKLIHVYGGRLVPKGATFPTAGKALAGRIPAIIRECVERSKLYVISNRPGMPFELTDADITRAAAGMKHHWKLLDGPQAVESTPAERLAESLGEVLNTKLANGFDSGLSKAVGELSKGMTLVRRAMGL